MTDCTLELTQDAIYNMVINKDRDLDQEIQAQVYSGDTLLGNFDLLQYTGATLTVKVKQNDNYSILVFSTTDFSILLNADGKFTLKKTAEELANIKAGEFYYNMFLSSPFVAKRAFLSGRFTIIQNVG
jgi:hypothetical protein